MGTEETLLLYVVGLLVSLAISYVVIRFAVVHALRSHSVWVAQGGVEVELERARKKQEREDAEFAQYKTENGQ